MATMKTIKQTVKAGKRLVGHNPNGPDYEWHGPCEVDIEVADDVIPELLDEKPAPPEPTEEEITARAAKAKLAQQAPEILAEVIARLQAGDAKLTGLKQATKEILA